MSAEEIRRLAEPLCLDRAVFDYIESLDKFVAAGCITLKYRDALLAYAAMVERCDNALKLHNNRLKDYEELKLDNFVEHEKYMINEIERIKTE